MHIVIALLCLCAVMVMIALYVGGFYLLYVALRWLRAKKASLADDYDGDPVSFWRPHDYKRLRFIGIVVAVACITSYTGQRLKWMGEDNANLKAKEFWVVGQVLNGFRLGLSSVIHPDVYIMWPAAGLQELIYTLGTSLLPKNDGEIGVWQNVWFNYHYCRKGRRNIGVNIGESSHKMRRILDQWWFSLEMMGSRPFADGQMEEEHYYRDYPTLAFWYKMYAGFYTKKLIGSDDRMAVLPEHVERYRQLSSWLWELPGKWQSSAKAQTFNKAHPKVVALNQTVLLQTLQALILGEIHERKFGCTNESVQRYAAARQEFMEGDDGSPAYKKMGDIKQGKRLWVIAIDSFGARSTRYVLSRYCGIEVAGKEDNSKTEYINFGKLHNRTPDEQADHNAMRNYEDEVQILEEQFKGRSGPQ